MATNRYVKPNDHGGWDVLKEGHRRTVIHARTKGEAIARARDLTRREGGGEIRVMNQMGKVTDSTTVARLPQRRAAA